MEILYQGENTLQRVALGKEMFFLKVYFGIS
jgi:hypothetical protein